MDGNIFNDCNSPVKEGHGNLKIKKGTLRAAQKKKRKKKKFTVSECSFVILYHLHLLYCLLKYVVATWGYVTGSCGATAYDLATGTVTN